MSPGVGVRNKTSSHLPPTASFLRSFPLFAACCIASVPLLYSPESVVELYRGHHLFVWQHHFDNRVAWLRQLGLDRIDVNVQIVHAV